MNSSKSSREYPARPLVGVGVVVIGPLGVLLIKRGKPPRPGSWSLPGGAQKLGETVHAAAQREVLEETGLKVEVQGLVDVVDSINPDDNGDIRYHYTLVDVVAHPIGGEIRPGGDADDAKWVSFEDLEAIELWSETRRVIALGAEMSAALPD